MDGNNKMKVTIIGTGSMYTKDNGACTLINDELLIDMPNGTLKQLLNHQYDLTKIKTILITHLHGDHTADIPFFLNNIFKALKLNDKITIIGPHGTKKQLIDLFNAYRFQNEEEFNNVFNLEFIEVNETIINLPNYKIETSIVSHGDEKPCLCYLINDKLGITGDSSLCPAIETLFNKATTIISDTSLITGDNNHLGIDNIKYLMKKYNVKVIPTHMRANTKQQLMYENIHNFQVVNDFYEIRI